MKDKITCFYSDNMNINFGRAKCQEKKLLLNLETLREAMYLALVVVCT